MNATKYRQESVSLSCALSAPTFPVVRRLFTGTNVIKWKHPRTNGEVFQVERRMGRDGEWAILSLADGLKYNDMDLYGLRGTEAAYRIRALSGQALSAPTPAIIVPPNVIWPKVRPAACIYRHEPTMATEVTR